MACKKLSDQTEKLSDISDASVATEKFVTNINSVSESAATLSNSYDNAAKAMGEEMTASNEFSEKIKEFLMQHLALKMFIQKHLKP